MRKKKKRKKLYIFKTLRRITGNAPRDRTATRTSATSARLSYAGPGSGEEHGETAQTGWMKLQNLMRDLETDMLDKIQHMFLYFKKKKIFSRDRPQFVSGPCNAASSESKFAKRPVGRGSFEDINARGERGEGEGAGPSKETDGAR